MYKNLMKCEWVKER